MTAIHFLSRLHGLYVEILSIAVACNGIDLEPVSEGANPGKIATSSRKLDSDSSNADCFQMLVILARSNAGVVEAEAIAPLKIPHSVINALLTTRQI
jgi:hypothetical protein